VLVSLVIVLKVFVFALKVNIYIDLEDFNGNKVYAKYSTFYVGGAATKYKLHVGGYSGTAGKLVLRRLLPYLLMWERGIWWRRYMVTYG
jgi:hypothetical protein